MQFFNRQFLANFNYIFTRARDFNAENIYTLSSKLKDQGITSLLISGDFTCMASKKEFKKAMMMLEHLKKRGFTIYAFPGNHDVYTKKAYRRKAFYNHFKDLLDFKGDYSLNLDSHGVAAYKLPHNVHLLLLDTTKFNTKTAANGLFSPEIEKYFKILLKEIPADGSIIVSSHFPYEEYKAPKAHMIDGNRLEVLIKSDPRIKLYLHGHRHIPGIEENETHLVIDSGSVSLKDTGSYSQTTFCEKEFVTSIHSEDKGKYDQKTISR